jgi:methylase of polypeptide subunit release factors
MDDAGPLSPPDLALLDLLRRLEDEGYDFVTPTPLTHSRVLKRRAGETGRCLRDILGWSLPFDPSDAPTRLVEALEAAGALTSDGDLRKSALRVSRLHGLLFLHSAYPTSAEDAVFLGPDSYRFADFIARELTSEVRGRILDVGGGAGVGALVAARRASGAEVWLSDVNPKALRLARINARHAGARLTTMHADGLEGAPEGLEVALANPPYIAGTARAYSDGGDMHGGRISVDWAKAALKALAPGGRLLLYSGTAIVDGGRDELRAALARLAERTGAGFDYSELDPDVFGEELEKPAYGDVERIAAIGCVLTKAG